MGVLRSIGGKGKGHVFCGRKNVILMEVEDKGKKHFVVFMFGTIFFAQQSQHCWFEMAREYMCLGVHMYRLLECWMLACFI